jgi:hypothetical protein
MVFIGPFLAVLVANFLVMKYRRDWRLAEHYQNELMDHARSLIENEDTPDEIADFAMALVRLATARFGTLGFILLWSYCSIAEMRGKRRPATGGKLSAAVVNAPKPLQEKVAKMTFSMAMVLERKSLFLGWMVVPMILSRRSSATVHPKSFNEAIRPQMLMSITRGSHKLADC